MVELYSSNRAALKKCTVGASKRTGPTTKDENRPFEFGRSSFVAITGTVPYFSPGWFVDVEVERRVYQLSHSTGSNRR